MDFIELHSTKRSRRTCLIAGIAFAFAIVVGGEIYRSNSVAGLFRTPVEALGWCALFVVVALVTAAVLLALTNVPEALERRNVKPAPAFFGTGGGMALMWVVLFAAWIPCLLAYWPGPFSYDIPTQTNYIFTGHWTTQQPPLHTLLWSLFLNLEGFLSLKAITWFALGQMAFLSGAFAYVLKFLASRKTSRVLFAIACVFFVLNPVVALISITPVKDSLLAGVLALLSVSVMRLSTDPAGFLKRKPACIGFGVCVLVCCLLRSNMMVAMVVFAIIVLVAFKDIRKRMAVLMGAPLLVAVLIMGPGYSIAHISPGSSAIASLPFQQVVNVVRNHASELRAEEVATVESILPLDEAVQDYNPRFADSVVRLFKGKSSGASSLANELIAVGKLWIAWGVRYPGDYVDSFLALNVPYWYPFAHTPDPYSERAYIETDIWRESEYYPVTLDSKAPALYDAYERVADFSALSNPVTRLVFSPSSVIWVVLISFVMLYNSERRRNALVCVLPLLFWASFMIGPVSNMRYVFPLFCLYPLLICAALQPYALFAPADSEKSA